MSTLVLKKIYLMLKKYFNSQRVHGDPARPAAMERPFSTEDYGAGGHPEGPPQLSTQSRICFLVLVFYLQEDRPKQAKMTELSVQKPSWTPFLKRVTFGSEL